MWRGRPFGKAQGNFGFPESVRTRGQGSANEVSLQFTQYRPWT
jgi:hypothetical protein